MTTALAGVDRAGRSFASTRGGTVAYWITTGILASELAMSVIWGLIDLPYAEEVNARLGFPDYFGNILTVWEALGVAAVLTPGLPRLKEWAYAGSFFKFTGAVASHIAVGDDVSTLIAPGCFAVVTMASWFLRPAGRRDLCPPPPLDRPG
jgi:hypothetical protein